MINENLNALAWELSSDNEMINDPNVTKAVSTMDEALETLQVAMVLLNTVAVDPAMMKTDDSQTPVAKKSVFGKKPLTSKPAPELKTS
ncbi:MAG: hypothetical protein J4F41_07095, partial [Alphaproteobacteria bacterium]|nr:hypothetical protein [Alphaproteobacteria bacterium]